MPEVEAERPSAEIRRIQAMFRLMGEEKQFSEMDKILATADFSAMWTLPIISYLRGAQPFKRKLPSFAGAVIRARAELNKRDCLRESLLTGLGVEMRASEKKTDF